MRDRRIAIIHAFSRHNAGDGLLVDLTIEALCEAGVRPEECTVMALDPESFADLSGVVRAPGEPTARPSLRLFGAVGEAVASLAGAGRVRTQLACVDAVVAVGGGYLVADSRVRRAGLFLNHFAQLRAASQHGGPRIYLPQSIGPLEGLAGRLARSALAEMDVIWARDDVTMRELSLANMRRCPDLAVMKLARGLGSMRPVAARGIPVLVGRELPDSGDYLSRLRALEARLDRSAWAVQADVSGPRSDGAFYEREGFVGQASLASVLASPGGPVVSVRLHGAIAALLAGRPAIHLAYERKGWGAFQDLGLSDFVHDARSFDPAIVAAQVEALGRDATAYWSRIAASSGRLTGAWDTLVADLASRLPPAGEVV